MDIKHKTVSTQSAEFLKSIIDLGKSGFTIDEAFTVLHNSTKIAVKKLMRDLVKRGLIMRLKEGVYWIIPYDQEVATYFPNWHLIVPYLVGDAKYYIGYYSALEIHSLITQPALAEQIVVNRQLKPSVFKINDRKFQFIYHNQKHFFGDKNSWVDSYNKVKCSDLEKTIIDCLYTPDYGGGIVEITKGLYKSKDKIDYFKMLEYAKRFKAQTVIKRLGFLLELLNTGNIIIPELQHLKTASVTLLEPSYEKKGKIVSRWRI